MNTLSNKERSQLSTKRRRTKSHNQPIPEYRLNSILQSDYDYETNQSHFPSAKGSHDFNSNFMLSRLIRKKT